MQQWHTEHWIGLDSYLGMLVFCKTMMLHAYSPLIYLLWMFIDPMFGHISKRLENNNWHFKLIFLYNPYQYFTSYYVLSAIISVWQVKAHFKLLGREKLFPILTKEFNTVQARFLPISSSPSPTCIQSMYSEISSRVPCIQQESILNMCWMKAMDIRGMQLLKMGSVALEIKTQNERLCMKSACVGVIGSLPWFEWLPWRGWVCAVGLVLSSYTSGMCQMTMWGVQRSSGLS